VTVVTATIAAGAKTATATCPTGKVVIGGGVRETDTKSLLESGPNGTNGWTAQFAQNMANGTTGTVTAYCVPSS
jgi:hypothetical protein